MREVSESGTFLRGSQTLNFEARWAAYCGQQHCIALANGTDALTLIAKATGVSALEVPAITCWYTGEGLWRGGCQPIPVDVDGRGHLVAPHAGAICTPLYGCEPTSAESAHCRYFDCAQAHGWRPPAHAVVAWSFYPTKTLGALGDAGGVTCNDQALADELRMLAGRDDLFRDRRQIVSRVDELQAAILSATLDSLDGWIADKKQIARWYSQNLPIGENLQLVYDVDDSNFYCLAVHVKRRNLLVAALAAAGISTKTHYPTPLHKYAAYWELPARRLPAAEQWCDTVLSLPCWPGLRIDQVEFICETIRAFYGE
jgi:dTDP-4-amino-4,6-dideoxygalactose transaminase